MEAAALAWGRQRFDALRPEAVREAAEPAEVPFDRIVESARSLWHTADTE
jgi:hypothetical protein